MPTCQSCNRNWSWKQTFRKSFSLHGEMSCPYCEQKQYVTPYVRKWSTIIPLIFFFIIMTGNLILGPSIAFFLALLGLLPLFLVIYPFWIKLSNKEEPLW